MYLKHAKYQRNEKNADVAKQVHNKRQKNNSDRSINVLESTVDCMQVEASDADPDTSTNNDDESVQLSNSTNSALKRIETRQQKKSGSYI